MKNDLRTWGGSVLVMAVAFTIFFGLIVGKRGADLIVFVAVLSLLLPTMIWFSRRSLRSR